MLLLPNRVPTVPQCLFVSPGEKMLAGRTVTVQFEDSESNVGYLGALSHEMRAVLMLGMVARDSTPKTNNEVRELLGSMLPEGEQIDTKNATRNHLSGQLARAGFVRVERNAKSPIYSATPEALRALPLASYLLQYGAEYDRSMISFTGKPSSRIGMDDPVRSRLTTLRFVADRLASGDRMMTDDLNELLKAKNSSVGRGMLLWLDNQGFFELDHWAISDEVAFCAGANINAPFGARSGATQHAVVAAIQKQGRHTFSDIEELLEERGIYDHENRSDTKSLRSVLFDMIERGQIDKSSGKFSDGEIIIDCDDTQYAAIRTLVEGLDQFANRDKEFVDTYGSQAFEIANNPSFIAAALARVRRTGGKMTSVEGEQTRSAILSALDRAGNCGAVSLTTIVEDIAAHSTAVEDGRVVGRLAARRALEHLSHAGRVRATKTPKGWLYERIFSATDSVKEKATY